MWLIMAVLSAVFAGLTSVLAKLGIRKTDSDIATAMRTFVVLIFSWIAAYAAGSVKTISDISIKSLLFLVLSGLSTGASWICYFKALSEGDINKVTPIDKSSTVISMLLAIVLFGETDRLDLKLIGAAVISAGIFLMAERKQTGTAAQSNRWIIYSVLSAVFASLTSILAKIGIDGVESNLGTAIRTGVVLIMAWLVVFMKGKQKKIKETDIKELCFIVLSGIATGVSWLCYYYAIQNGVVSIAVPVDKLSIVVTVAFSRIVFKERLGKKAFAGLCLILCGTIAIAIWT